MLGGEHGIADHQDALQKVLRIFDWQSPYLAGTALLRQRVRDIAPAFGFGCDDVVRLHVLDVRGCALRAVDQSQGARRTEHRHSGSERV